LKDRETETAQHPSTYTKLIELARLLDGLGVEVDDGGRQRRLDENLGVDAAVPALQVKN
jgi:hypothetical protein